MTQDEIIEMAEQAGWTGIYSHWISPTEIERLTVPVTMEQIEAFVKLVAKRKREACASVCDALFESSRPVSDESGDWVLGTAIRARGEK